jgi:hypothetical protein
MKKLLFPALITLILCSSILAETPEDSPWNFQADVDMYLGVKMGIRYEMNDKLNLVTGFGINAIESSQYCYSLYASYQTMDIYGTWNVGVNAGILQGVFDNTSSEDKRYVYINPGLTMYVSYPVVDRLRISAQGGMVMMIGFDRNSWGTSLEPFIGLSLIYSEK